MAESSFHNHNLDVTLWSCNTRNWKVNFRISPVGGQSLRLIPVLLQVNGPCDRTLWNFVCNDFYTQRALYKRKPTGSRIGLHIYTNNDGQFVQAGCVGTAEISTKVTWSFSRIVVLRTPPSPPPSRARQILLRPTFLFPKSPRRSIAPASVYGHID